MKRRPDTDVGKIWIVTKSDLGMGGAVYVVGVFLNAERAQGACKGPGTFHIAKVDPNRAYARGTMLDVETVSVLTAASIRAVT